MMNRQTIIKTKPTVRPGFTLFELVVVLAIISAMLAIVLPFCKRSNDGLAIKHDCSNIAQTLRYAINLSEHRKKAVKFVFNQNSLSYTLWVKNIDNHFEPVEDFTGEQCFLHQHIHLRNIEGFEQSGPEHCLVFDPVFPWPKAYISFSATDLIMTISIQSKNVDIEEQVL